MRNKIRNRVTVKFLSFLDDDVNKRNNAVAATKEVGNDSCQSFMSPTDLIIHRMFLINT